MNNSVNRQKQSPEQQQKKKQLLQKIIQIKNKTSHLDQLQSQIKTIENLIKIQQQKNIKINFSRTADSTLKYNSNSNKKIKVYQLKKKLQTRAKQYKEQHLCYMNKLRKQEEIMIQITQTDQHIRMEKQKTNQLDRLYAALVSDLNRLQEKVNQNKELLKSQKQVSNVFNKEKIKRIQEIKRLKKIIKNGSENTEPDDDIAYSMEQIPQQNNNQTFRHVNFQLQLTLNNTEQNKSPNFQPLTQNRKFSEQILIQQDQSQLPVQISFKKHRLTPSTEHFQNKSFPQSKIYEKNTILKSCLQFQHEIITLQQKIQKQTHKHQNLLQSVSLVKRGNRNLQASVKHTIVTLQLLKNKAENLKRTTQIQNKELLQNISKCEIFYKKLRTKQGQRGQIRGKLGIKVQNTRMLGIINEQISLDLQKLQSKLPRLKNLSAQCLDIVKRIIGPQRVISQNFNNILQ